MYNRSFAHITLAIILVIWVVPFVALITTSFRSEVANLPPSSWTIGRKSGGSTGIISKTIQDGFDPDALN